ncbi:MAG: hypothetical protein WCK83_03250, partial [Burkholderiales bacterium]
FPKIIARFPTFAISSSVPIAVDRGWWQRSFEVYLGFGMPTSVNTSRKFRYDLTVELPAMSESLDGLRQ